MRTITIVAEQITDRCLAAAIPTRGVESVSVSRNVAVARAADVESYRAFRNPNRFDPRYRVELVVADDAVETVLDGVSFAYGAGIFSDAEVWVSAPALALAA